MQKYISLLSQISGISGSCFSTASKVDSSRAANCPELKAGSDGKHQWFWIYYYLMQCNPTVYACLCLYMCVSANGSEFAKCIAPLQNLCAEIDGNEVKKWQKKNGHMNKKIRESLKNICRIFSYLIFNYYNQFLEKYINEICSFFHQYRQFSNVTLMVLIIDENINSRYTADIQNFFIECHERRLPHICVPFLT